jgi:hypothetical protein
MVKVPFTEVLFNQMQLRITERYMLRSLQELAVALCPQQNNTNDTKLQKIVNCVSEVLCVNFVDS